MHPPVHIDLDSRILQRRLAGRRRTAFVLSGGASLGALQEEAQIPLHITAFDVLSGEEVRLSDGPAMDAVLASSAIPGVLPSVAFGDRILVDGGVVNNTPISHAVELGAERVYVLSTVQGDSRALPVARSGALDFVVYGLTLLDGVRLEADLVRYGADVELIVLRATNSQPVQPTDFGHASRLIHDGLTSARSALSRAVLRSEAAA